MAAHRQPATKPSNKQRIPKRQRFLFKFWLDIAKPEERAIAEQSDSLKSRRQWQPSVRDALKLLYSLREKRIDVLLTLFPWVEEYFRARFAHEDSPANREFAAILKQQADILSHLANRPALPESTPQTPKLLNIPKVDTPVFDDDDDDDIVLDIKKDTSTSSANNFLSSLAGLG